MRTYIRRGFLAVVAITAVVLPGLLSSQELVGFRTPSNNIFCLLQGPYEDHADSDLRCDIQQLSTRPPSPPRDCHLGWGDAFEIGHNADRAERACHGDTVRDDRLPALAYGSEWRQSGFVCRSEVSGLTCANAKGHGFTLSRSVQKIF